MAIAKKKAYAGRKQSDQEIVTLANGISDYITSNQKTLTIVLVGVAVAALAISGLSLKRSMDEQKAGPLFAAAYDVYSAPAGASPDYARALGLFQEVQKKYPSSRSGSIAQYYVANTLMDMGRLDEALKEYQACIRDHSGDKLLLGLVYERMGYLYRELNKQQDAINAFAQSEALNGTGLVTMELARLYEASGNEPEALKKYKLVSEKLAGTPIAMEAAAKVQKPGTSATEGKSSADEVKKGK